MEISGADAIDVNDEGGVLIECNSMDKGLQAAEIIKLIGKDREIGEIFRLVMVAVDGLTNPRLKILGCNVQTMLVGFCCRACTASHQ